MSDPTPDIVLRPQLLDSSYAAALLRQFEAEIDERYPGLDFSRSPSATASELAPPDGRFLVAFLVGDPAGCAGLKRLDDETAEVKRVFVAAGARRHGVGRALMMGIEREARERGYR